MSEHASTASLTGSHTGRVLAGRYALGERLGEGATAEVYAAVDQALEIQRAIKLLAGGGGTRQRLRDRLKAEAKGMARLDHPNILPIYDVGAEGVLDYVVMKLADGGSLQERLSSPEGLSPEEACGFVVQLLSALDAAHSAGIVHRDVKPQNILLDGSGHVLLSDFGIALWQQNRSTQTGMAMGSLPYMAPEQRLDASRVGPAADLYAAGATLYHLLTSANPVDLFASPDFSPRWEEVPLPLRPFIRRATSYEVADRFPDAAVMAQALLAAMPDVVSVLHEPAPSAVSEDRAWSVATTTAVGLLLGEEPTAIRVDSWVRSMAPPRTVPQPMQPADHHPGRTVAAILLLLVSGLSTFFAWPELLEAPPEQAERVADGGAEPLPQPEVPTAGAAPVIAAQEARAEATPVPTPVRVRPAPPPASSIVKEPTLPLPDTIQPVIAGVWVGDVNTIPKVVTIQSSGGDIWSLWRSDTGGAQAPTVSVGDFDPTTGRLSLKEQDGVEQQGRYEFTLDKNGDLVGRRFMGSTGRSFHQVVLQRARNP